MRRGHARWLERMHRLPPPPRDFAQALGVKAIVRQALAMDVRRRLCLVGELVSAFCFECGEVECKCEEV